MNELMENDNIVPLIASGRWEEVLVSLTSDMDAWNIDIIKLNQRFNTYIKEMTILDLRVPGKILLTAAIIHRMKSDTLKQVEQLEQVQVIPQQMLNGHSDIVIPPIQIPLRREPKRKVSLAELIQALNKAMQIKDKRGIKEVFKLDIKGENITEQIEKLYEKIIDFLKKTEVIPFSNLLKPKASSEDKLVDFNSLLHLSNQERVYCDQKQLFGEIFIKRIDS